MFEDWPGIPALGVRQRGHARTVYIRTEAFSWIPSISFANQGTRSVPPNWLYLQRLCRVGQRRPNMARVLFIIALVKKCNHIVCVRSMQRGA